MVIAYHAVFATYGTWLPNDPRGSFSQDVYKQELRALGNVKHGRQEYYPDQETLRRFWTAALPRLKRPPYFISDGTREVIAQAFGNIVAKFQLAVPACAIMNDHVHILVLRSDYRIEYLVNQLKGAATRALALHQTPWAENCGRIYINNEETLYSAAEYIEANPIAAWRVPQNWPFVKALPPRPSSSV